MPAWIYVLAVAAVVFVAWFGWARRWWHSVRYSWTRARHLVDLGETEVIPGAEWGSMILAEERAMYPIWLPAPPLDWREQTAADLSPEALERLCGPEQPQEPAFVRRSPGNENRDRDADSGPGGPFSSAPGPDPDPDAPGWPCTAGPVAAAGKVGRTAQLAAPVHPSPPPTRLADTGDVRDAHLLADVLAELRRQDDDCAAYLSRLRASCLRYRLEVAGALG